MMNFIKVILEIVLYRGSYMSAHVLLNLLNKLGKIYIKYEAFRAFYLFFATSFNKFNNTRA